MKVLFAVCILLLLISCRSQDRESGGLKQRVDRLEERLDSITGKRNPDQGSYGSGINSENKHCNALTKKGSACKRKPKANGYCWQHGG